MSEIERLKAKCDRQARILQAILPEQSGSFFICGSSDQKDSNGLPDRLIVCATYGSDVTAIYARVR